MDLTGRLWRRFAERVNLERAIVAMHVDGATLAESVAWARFEAADARLASVTAPERFEADRDWLLYAAGLTHRDPVRYLTAAYEARTAGLDLAAIVHVGAPDPEIAEYMHRLATAQAHRTRHPYLVVLADEWRHWAQAPR